MDVYTSEKDKRLITIIVIMIIVMYTIAIGMLVYSWGVIKSHREKETQINYNGAKEVLYIPERGQ